ANMHSFLGTTVHWIDSEWTLRCRVLDIVPLDEYHTGERTSAAFDAACDDCHAGENICAAFCAACEEFGVLDKLLAITTDNATNNDTFLAHLERRLRSLGVAGAFLGAIVHC